MSPRSPEHSPSHPTRSPTLSGDIIFRIVRSNFHTTRVIISLSKTCRLYCGALDPLLYRADVLMVRERVFKYRRQASDWYILPGSMSMNAMLRGLYDLDRSALHWAIKDNGSVDMTVARKSIKAALAYWPDYLHVKSGNMGGMTPLQLAATYGADEIVQELIKACPRVDAPITLDTDIGPCTKLPLSKFLLNEEFSATSLHIAMLYGHVHIAETLARLMPDLEDPQETPSTSTLSPLNLAAVCKLPSVIKILQTRGYQVPRNEGHLGDTGLTPMHFAASTEGNEETLGLLLSTGYSINDVDNGGYCPIGTAIKFRCPSNALFLIKNLSAEEKLNIADKYFDKLLQSDDFLPLVKPLLEHTSIERKRARRYKYLILKHSNNPRRRRNLLDMLDFLIHHPNINFSKKTHADLEAKITETREEVADELVDYFVKYSYRYKK